MPIIRTIKNSRAVQHLLLRQCRKLLQQAQAAGNPAVLTAARAFYALGRRVREYLESKKPWGIDSATPPLQRDSFLLLREMLSFLIEKTRTDDQRGHNRTLNRLEMLAKWPELRSYPLRCYFETTNRCNLRCRMCGQSFLRGDRIDMPREAIEQISPVFKFMDDVSIFGYGEALMVDYIPELLDAIPDPVNSWLVTNGILLTPEKNRMLIERGLKTLFISIDAATPETYKYVRGVDVFDKVVSQVRNLQEQKKSLGSETPRLTLTFVAMQRNIEELPDFVRLARSLGIDRVIADYLTVYSEDMREQSLYYDQERSDRIVQETAEVARSEGVAFEAPPRFLSDAERGTRKPRCAEPWEFIYFRADGFVQSCCTNDSPMGRWVDKDFFEYWNSPEYQAMRRTLYTPQQCKACKDCVHVCFRDIRRPSSHFHIMPESR